MERLQPLEYLVTDMLRDTIQETPCIILYDRSNWIGIAKTQQKILFIYRFHDTLPCLDLSNSYCVFLRITLYNFILIDSILTNAVPAQWRIQITVTCVSVRPSVHPNETVTLATAVECCLVVTSGIVWQISEVTTQSFAKIKIVSLLWLETNCVKCRTANWYWAACACDSTTDQLVMLSTLAGQSQQNSTSLTELTLPQLALHPLSPVTRQGSSVTNVICYAPDPGSINGRDRNACFVHCVHTGSGAHRPSYQTSTGVNLSGHEATHHTEENLDSSASFCKAMLNKWGTAAAQ